MHDAFPPAPLMLRTGIFSGVSEAHFVLANLVNRQDKPAAATVCGGVSTGTLMGQPVLVAMTGEGGNEGVRMGVRH